MLNPLTPLRSTTRWTCSVLNPFGAKPSDPFPAPPQIHHEMDMFGAKPF